MCIRRRFHRERLFPLFGPQFARPFTVLAVELFGHPDHRAVDHGAVVAGQVYDPGLDDKAAEFDQMPGALAAFDRKRSADGVRLEVPGHKRLDIRYRPALSDAGQGLG